MSDEFELLCSGILRMNCGGTECEGYIDLPCGMSFDTSTADNQIQMPFRYQILSARAAFLPCCHWQDTDPGEEFDPTQTNNQAPSLPDTFDFVTIKPPEGFMPPVEINSTEGGQPVSSNWRDTELFVGGWAHDPVDQESFVINPFTFEILRLPTNTGTLDVPTKCTHPSATVWHQGQDNRPPCNGAKSSCPFYSPGRGFQYIKDEDLDPGKEIIGEMVQEIRSLLKDWRRLGEAAQALWERSFRLPYIWGKDFSDPSPMVITTVNDDGLTTATYTILTQVYWHAASELAEQIQYPSTPVDGTPLENIGGEFTPPSFPTFVSRLTVIPPSVSISFPPTDPFPYFTWEPEGNKVLLAGRGPSLANVYIVNSALINRTIGDLIVNDRSSEIDLLINDLILEAQTEGNLPGFKATRTDLTRFWALEGGIELKVGTNEIFVLCKFAGKWSFISTIIDFTFYHADLVQEGFESDLITPEKIEHGNFILTHSSLAPETKFVFNALSYGSGSVSISKAYRFFIKDNSLGRAFGSNPTKPDTRYWGISKETGIATGDAVSGGALKWYHFDHCRRFIIEMLDPDIPTAAPAGIDRSWEPKSITLGGQPMKVHSRTGDGVILPVRFMIVEPQFPTNFTTPLDTDPAVVEWELYTAGDPSVNDSYMELVTNFPDNNLPSEVGGAPFLTGIPEPPYFGFAISNHLVSFSDSRLEILLPDGRGEVSYMVEFSTEDGHVIGRKWVYGVGEIAKAWFRDVDIDYVWSAYETPFVITPNGSNERGAPDAITWTDPVRQAGTTLYRTACGEHDMSFFERHGPMFWPYDACIDHPQILVADRSVMFYKVLANIAYPGERWRGPDLHRAYFIEFRGSCLLLCVFCNIWGNLVRGQSSWAGTAKFRGPISEPFNSDVLSLYQSFGWTLPKMGNRGREAYRQIRTMHYRDFIVPTSTGPRLFTGWLPSLPHIPSKSVFDSGQPRNLFSQSVERLVPNTFDYTTYQGQLQILLADNTIPQLGNVEETVSWIRRKFKDVYRRHRLINPNGVGTRWPGTEFRLEFIDDNIMWAFPEPRLPLVRNPDADSKISGLILEKPDLDLPNDAFNRVVEKEIEENQYTLNLVDTQYDSQGQIIEYAKVYINPSFPVYFDKFTGVILDYSSPTSSDPMFYARSGSVSIFEGLTLSGSGSVSEPAFEPMFDLEGIEEVLFPTDPVDLDDLVVAGNLIADNTIFVYPTKVDTLLDEVEWVGVVKALEIKKLNVNLLPRIEINYVPNTGYFEDVDGGTSFSIYPTTNIALRNTQSNRILDTFNENLYGGLFTWEGLSDSDLILAPPPQNGLPTTSGIVDEITIITGFRRPIEFSKVTFKYVLNAIEGHFLLKDPSLSVTVSNNVTGDSFLLLEKQETTIGNRTQGSTSFSRTLELDTEGSSFEITSLEIKIGKRNNRTSFTLSDLNLEVKVLDARTTSPLMEEIVVLNPKYIISTGRHDNTPLAITSNRFMSGILRSYDVSDFYEYAGIAETWHGSLTGLDLDPNNPELMSVGKTQKNHLTVFDSYDIRKNAQSEDFNGVIFRTDTVLEAELLQGNLVQDYLNLIEERTQLLTTEFQYYIHPYDLQKLEKIGLNLPSPVTRSLYIQNLSASGGTFSAAAISGVEPGWQDFGFYGCVGRRFIHSPDCGDHYEEPGICSVDGNTALSAPTLFYYEFDKSRFLNILDAGGVTGNRDVATPTSVGGSLQTGSRLTTNNPPDDFATQNRILERVDQLRLQNLDRLNEAIRRRYNT